METNNYVWIGLEPEVVGKYFQGKDEVRLYDTIWGDINLSNINFMEDELGLSAGDDGAIGFVFEFPSFFDPGLAERLSSYGWEVLNYFEDNLDIEVDIDDLSLVF